jgi:hypothetical protein
VTASFAYDAAMQASSHPPRICSHIRLHCGRQRTNINITVIQNKEPDCHPFTDYKPAKMNKTTQQTGGRIAVCSGPEQSIQTTNQPAQMTNLSPPLPHSTPPTTYSKHNCNEKKKKLQNMKTNHSINRIVPDSHITK